MQNYVNENCSYLCRDQQASIKGWKLQRIVMIALMIFVPLVKWWVEHHSLVPIITEKFREVHVEIRNGQTLKACKINGTQLKRGILYGGTFNSLKRLGQSNQFWAELD